MDNVGAIVDEHNPNSKDDIDRDLKTPLIPAPQDGTDRELRRNLVAFWMLGLCNNFGYVVMLSAAFDIMEEERKSSSNNTSPFNDHPVSTNKYRDHNSTGGFHCNPVSTGVVLLADIFPTLIITLTAPFYMQRINYHIRIAFVIASLAISLVILALSQSVSVSIVSVVMASISSGFGEITFLSFSSHFKRSTVSAWSSGTGMSGVTGAVAYAGLRQIGLSKRSAVLSLLVVPVVFAGSVWGLLKYPTSSSTSNPTVISPENNMSLKEKLNVVLSLQKYMIPLFLVYFAEYLVNQGLYELLYYPVTWLTQAQQYRWFQVDYQIAVFVARSSVYLIHIRKVLLLSLLQWCVFIFLLLDVVYTFVPSLWLTLSVIFFEGLLGGAVYVNTFFAMSEEVPAEVREFSLGAASFGDALGIMLAGLVSIPLHNALCSLRRS